MERLSLYGCAFITGASVPYLHHLVHLKKLYLDDTQAGWSDDDLRRLKAALPPDCTIDRSPKPPLMAFETSMSNFLAAP